MLDKYFKILKDSQEFKKLFVESVLEICNQNKTKEEIEEGSFLKAENFDFKFIINKDDFVKIKIIANSAIKFMILQNQEKIKQIFLKKLGKDIIVLIV
jgi:hypothetical protein